MRRELCIIILVLIYLFILFFYNCSPTINIDEENSSYLKLNLPPYFGEKLNIAVLELKNRSEYSGTEVGRGISQMLVTALSNTGRFRLVERNTEVLSKILEEQGLALSGVINQNSIIQVGKLLNAQALVIGEITEFGIRKYGGYIAFSGSKKIITRVAIDARMVNTQTGEIMVSSTGIGVTSTKTSGIALTIEFGTEGFDQTTIGISTRKAVNQIATKFALSLNQYNN